MTYRYHVVATTSDQLAYLSCRLELWSPDVGHLGRQHRCRHRLEVDDRHDSHHGEVRQGNLRRRRRRLESPGLGFRNRYFPV